MIGFAQIHGLQEIDAPPIKRETLSSFASFGLTQTDVQENSDDYETDDNSATNTGAGRPRLEVLDALTIELPRVAGRPRLYRCAGKGCNKRWQPRTAARVLAHCKKCLKLTTQERQLAGSASAKSSPGAIVDGITPPTSLNETLHPSSGTTVTQPAGKLTADTPMPVADTFFGARGRKQTHAALDLAIVLLFCQARIPPAVADLQVWKNVFRIGHPSYEPASRTKLMDSHIMSEQSRVNELQLKILKDARRTEAGRVMLLEGQECTDVSHTGKWIADLVMRVCISNFSLIPVDEPFLSFKVIDQFGAKRVIAVSSDNTGNTRVARLLIANAHPHILNLPDPEHHLNNTIKQIVCLPFFVGLDKSVRGTVKYFKQSGMAKGKLRKLRTELSLGPGIETPGKTRFAGIVWSAISVRRNILPIRKLCTSDDIEILVCPLLIPRNLLLTFLLFLEVP